MEKSYGVELLGEPVFSLVASALERVGRIKRPATIPRASLPSPLARVAGAIYTCSQWAQPSQIAVKAERRRQPTDLPGGPDEGCRRRARASREGVNYPTYLQYLEGAGGYKAVAGG